MTRSLTRRSSHMMRRFGGSAVATITVHSPNGPATITAPGAHRNVEGGGSPSAPRGHGDGSRHQTGLLTSCRPPGDHIMGSVVRPNNRSRSTHRSATVDSGGRRPWEATVLRSPGTHRLVPEDTPTGARGHTDWCQRTPPPQHPRIRVWTLSSHRCSMISRSNKLNKTSKSPDVSKTVTH